MADFCDSFSQKDRRRYAAVETKKIGHGGTTYIFSLFGCDDKTVKKGMLDLHDEEALQQASVRALGGGRKKLIEAMPDINKAFLGVLSSHTEGDPMDNKVRRTALSRSEIFNALKKRI
jgi:hypothetical protein